MPDRIIPPIEIGVLKNTESNVVTLLMLGSIIVTVGVLMIVEKFGAKSEVRVCGVIVGSCRP